MDERFERVIAAIDRLNSDDPNTDVVGGTARPRELVYSERVTAWVARLRPGASEALRIAARGQHVQRWTIPRERYERTRRGYLRWRETLKTFHAERVAELMRAAGYPEADVARVREIMSKRRLPEDPETQALEDALCLVFLDTQLEDLKRKTLDETMRGVVRKTWQKMSPPAREEALRLPLSDETMRWVKETV